VSQTAASLSNAFITVRACVLQSETRQQQFASTNGTVV